MFYIMLTKMKIVNKQVKKEKKDSKSEFFYS